MTATALHERYRVGDLDLTRVGYGAMQLAGPGVFGPPKDRDAAVAVLRDGGRARHHPHRHRRLLRPARHQRDHPRGAAPVPGRPAHRHQGRRPPRRAGRLAARARAGGAARAGPRQPRTPRPRRARRRQPARRRLRRARARFDRRAVRRRWPSCSSRASSATSASAPSRRAGRRGAGDRAGRVRAEHVQHRPPRRRRAGRPTSRAGHRLRAVLPARRLHAAAVRRRSTRSRPARRDADGRRAGLAAAALAQHPADPRHVVRGPPAREHRRAPAWTCRRTRSRSSTRSAAPNRRRGPGS